MKSLEADLPLLPETVSPLDIHREIWNNVVEAFILDEPGVRAFPDQIVRLPIVLR